MIFLILLFSLFVMRMDLFSLFVISLYIVEYTEHVIPLKTNYSPPILLSFSRIKTYVWSMDLNLVSIWSLIFQN